MIKKYRNTGGSFSRRILPAPKNFIQLDDCPPNYTGSASKFVTVKAGENGLEFTALPPLAITDTFVVGSQAAMLALTAQTGDVAVRTDIDQTFILQGTDPSILGNWVLLLVSPTHAIGGALHTADTITNLKTKISAPDILITSQAAEISTLTAKASPTSSDLLIIEDAADTNKKKKITIANLPAAAPAAHDLAGALHTADTITNLKTKISAPDILITSQAAEISTLTAKASPTSSDLLIIEDAADSNKKKKVTISSLPITNAFPEYTFFADTMKTPVNSEYPRYGAALAPAMVDPNNGSIIVRQFGDSTDWGVAFDCFIPSGATNLIIDIVHRAKTAPGTTKQVYPVLYCRQIPDNAAIPSWSGENNLTLLDIPTNTRFQYDTQTIALSTLSLTAGRVTQFEFERDSDEATDNLVDDWYLMMIRIRFS